MVFAGFPEGAQPPPAEMESAAFVDWCMERFSAVKPLVDWLTEEMDGL